MYSLSFPVTLPDDRAFFVDERTEAPPLCGNLRFSCGKRSHGFPQILFVEGLSDLPSAKSFAAELASALRCASLQLGHSFQPSDHEPVIADMGFYNGQFPTIFETTLKAKPAECTAYVLMSEHLINLAREVDQAISSGKMSRLSSSPELSVAIKIYSEMEFAGGETAKFVVLLSEVAHAADAALSSDKILTVLGMPHRIEQLDLNATVSIGIGVYPGDGKDAETLLKNADAALSQAKANGGNTRQAFERDMVARGRRSVATAASRM